MFKMKLFLIIKLIYFMTLLATTMGCSLRTTLRPIKLDSWMKDLAPHIKDMPLTDIAIPGSHDSMTYGIFANNGAGPDTNIGLRFAYAKSVVKYAAVQWAKTQNLNTMEQLLAGIRFLDLRLATKPSTTEFYYTHGLYAGEISCSLDQVKKFVDTHPEEVVILYFQHFYGFTDEDHKRLIRQLYSLFSSRLVPEPNSLIDVTINNLAKLNQSIIIVYRDGAVQKYSKLWYPDLLVSPWPQKQSTKELLEYFHNTLRPPGILFAHQAVLTPSTDFIASRIFSNLLEQCAKPVLRDVLPVIASDFFPGPVKDMRPSPINVMIGDFIELENNLFPRTIIALNDKLTNSTYKMT